MLLNPQSHVTCAAWDKTAMLCMKARLERVDGLLAVGLVLAAVHGDRTHGTNAYSL